MSKKTMAAAALVLCAVASTGLAKGTKVSVPLIVESDTRATYMLVEYEKIADHVFLATTVREGEAGTEYAARVIDCDPLRTKDIAEGQTLAAVRAASEQHRDRITTDGLAAPEEGTVVADLGHQTCDAVAKR